MPSAPFPAFSRRKPIRKKFRQPPSGGFDNERGKGDHRHDGRREIPYAFVDVETLLADFWRAAEEKVPKDET